MVGTYDFLSSLFYTFLFIKLIRYADSQPAGKCDVDVFFLLDEFANIGTIPEFNKKISTARSRRNRYMANNTKYCSIRKQISSKCLARDCR